MGQQGPDFTTPDLNEHMHAFEAYRGHPVVLNFWATWCEPCRKEMPLLQTLYETHQNAGLVLLAVSQDTADHTDAVRSYVDASGFTFPVLLDPHGSVATSYNVQLLPSTIFVNAQGVVTAKHHGPMAQTQIERYLTALLSR